MQCFNFLLNLFLLKCSCVGSNWNSLRRYCYNCSIISFRHLVTLNDDGLEEQLEGTFRCLRCKSDSLGFGGFQSSACH